MDRQDSDHESDYKQSEAEYQLLQVIRKYLKCSAPRQFKNLLEINGHSSTCTVGWGEAMMKQASRRGAHEF